MKRLIFLLAFAAGCSSAAVASDGSLEKCGDLSASVRDVAHHCRRALNRGGLTDQQKLAAQLNLGDALLALGQPAGALDTFNAAEPAGRDQVMLYMGRADAYEALGRTQEAARDLEHALSLAPHSLDVRLSRGAFFLRAGRPDAALQEFNAAVNLRGNDADALYNRGLTLLALGRQAEAEGDFSAVLREHPSDAGALVHRGRARMGRDDTGALADFDKAAEVAPEWAEPWFFSGRLLDNAGRTDEADMRFRRAFELGYPDPWLQKRIRSLGG